ncbi:MAG: deoxyribonuclease HsdR, partial [Deltaproteobacteria bacterium]
IATIFSYQANEDDKDADGMLDQDIDLDSSKLNQHSRDKLESHIADYNQMFGSNYTTRDSKSFYDYYRNVADRVKAREIDILIVVNMFLTGFDSKTLNTLYVDKNLKYHGLIQAYSRTNRILNELKSHGNIVAFRNLKKNTDAALKLFADKNAEETVFVKPYQEYVDMFNQQVASLRAIAGSPDAVDGLVSEEQKEEFVKSFRQLLKLKNTLVSFAEFVEDDVDVSAQEFEEYKSKYLDIYDIVARDTEKVSILSDLDFSLELIRRDKVNVGYILRLMAQMVGASEKKQKEIKSTLDSLMSSEPKLRSKRELIEQFLKSVLPNIDQSSDVEAEFYSFWDEQKQAEFDKLCTEAGLDRAQAERIIATYLIRGEKPRDHEIADSLIQKPSILERDSLLSRVKELLNDF